MARLVTPACTRAVRFSKSDVEHAVHLGDAEDDGVLLRDGAAGKRGAGPARHDLDAVLVAELQHRRHLLGRATGSTTASGILR